MMLHIPTRSDSNLWRVQRIGGLVDVVIAASGRDVLTVPDQHGDEYKIIR